MSMTDTYTLPKPTYNLVNLSVGIIGMLLATYANLLPQMSLLQKSFYFIGAVLMLISSTLEKQRFFMVLQLVIVGSTAIAFAPLAPIIKTSFSVACSVIAILYFIFTGQCKDKLTIFGCLGIAILAIGYAVTNPVIYLLGSIALFIYSLLSYKRGIKIAIVWVIMNIVFSITAGIAVWEMYLS